MSKSFIFGLNWIFKHILKDIDNLSDTTTKITFGVLSLGMIGHCCYTFKTTNNKNIDVVDKYQFTRNGFTEFMIIDSQGDHYNVTNSIWYWKWNSIEDWHKIQTNKQLVMKYYGLRIPLLGIFPNIVMSDQAKVLDSMSSEECRVLEFNNNRVNDFTKIFRENKEK